MTDKEQIMIDGVDITKCVNCLRICTTTTRLEAICKKYGCCSGHNCLYKQLARKTQECEELKEENENLRNSLSDSLMFKFTSQDNELINKTAECKKYKQALNEIENYINSQGIDNKWNMYIQRFRSGILNIINKAKDGNNE